MTTRELRTEFKAVANTFRINPVTNTAEPFLSFRAKTVRILIVSTLVLMLLFMMAIVVVAIIAYRLIMTILLYTPRGSVREDKTQESETNGEFYQYNAKTISSITAAVINLTFVLFLHFVRFQHFLSNHFKIKLDKDVDFVLLFKEFTQIVHLANKARVSKNADGIRK